MSLLVSRATVAAVVSPPVRSQVSSLLKPWPLLVSAIALSAFLVRVAVIHKWGGGYDLRIYEYFGTLAAHGHNPYNAPANGPIPGVYGDNQPFEMLLLGGLLAFTTGPTISGTSSPPLRRAPFC